MDRISSFSKNYEKSLTSPNSQSQTKISKNSTNKMKSPTYKTPLKAQQVNFRNANSPMSINMNKTYDNFIPNLTPLPSISKPQNNINKNDKKRRLSFSSHNENNSGSNKKRIKNDQYPTPSKGNDNIISPKFLGNKTVLNKTMLNSSSSNNKFINITNAYSKMSSNIFTLNNKNMNNNHPEKINKYQSQYSNIINAIENSENMRLTSPNNDWNSKNLLSSHIHRNIKFVKNGYSEKLVNMINKKKSKFHIWLFDLQNYSTQKSVSNEDLFKDMVIVEVKKVKILNCNIAMTCELVDSFQKDFSELYHKEGGTDALDIIVLTNTHRSWPPQNNIENTEIKKRLKELKEKRMNKATSYSSSFTTKNQTGNEKEKELTMTNHPITLGEKPIQNGTLLIIKDSKTILNHPKLDNLSFSSPISKKSIIIYNDLFLIFNL